MNTLAVSRAARYFYHDCERYLKYFITPRQAREGAGIPQPPFNQSPVTAAILEGGYVWETEVVSRKLGGVVRVARVAPGTALKDRTFDPAATVEELKKLKEGEYLYQATLRAPLEFYEAYGIDPTVVEVAECRPDLIQRMADSSGRPKFRILDVKASDMLKTAHKVQTALYCLILKYVIEVSGIEGVADFEHAGIWLYGADQPETFDLGVVRPHVEEFLTSDLMRIAVADAGTVGWHLTHRCEWCEYFTHCRTEAERAKSVSLIPYLSTPGREFLRANGINTLADMEEFLRAADAPEVLSSCASLAGKEHRLTEAVASLREDLVKPLGASSLAMPRGENVRLILTLQKEPVSGRVYAAALLRTGGQEVYGTSRHEEQFVAKNPAECGEVRRTFLLRVHALLSELDRYNAVRERKDQKSLQTYVFDSYEVDLLRELLLESLSDPAIHRETLSLLFHFHSEDLVTAETHPAGEIDFPVVVLTDVVRLLLALPVPVAYHLADVVQALPSGETGGFQYTAREYFNFRLSNPLRSDAIAAVWHQGKTDYTDRIARELKIRLWATNTVIQGIRVAAVDPTTGSPYLFAWPPKFRLHDTLGFNDATLSRLAFLTQYESLMAYLDIRSGRMLPKAERERLGICLNLRSMGGDRFEAGPKEAVDQLEAGYGRWLLTEDTAEGETAQMAFPDYRNRDKPYVPRGHQVAFAELQQVDLQLESSPVVTLAIKSGADSPPVQAGRRYMLHPGYTDWNSGRVIARLSEIDQGHTGQPVTALLHDPLGQCSRLQVESSPRAGAMQLAAHSGFTPSQAAAFAHLHDHSLTLVWGPPGTGKTHFLGSAVLNLYEAHRQADRPLRVLVSGYTHSAIENCLKKLDQLARTRGIQLDAVKVGPIQTKGCEHLASIAGESGATYLCQHSQCVVGATTYALLKLFRDRPNDFPFDVVVIDEGSQVRVPEALLAISRLAPGGRLLVAGDDMQLPPIVHGVYPEPQAGDPLLHRSIFEALREPDRGLNKITCQLYESFRMNDSLCEFSKSLYGSDYAPANPDVACRRMKTIPANAPSIDWIEAVLDPQYPWIVCVLEGIQAASENEVEADLVAELTKHFRIRLCAKNGKPYSDDGEGDEAFWRDGLFIVSPHHAQIRSISRSLEKRGLRKPFFVDTVDKMQGQECEAVVVSYGVSDSEYAMQEGEFIYSLNRLNVAVTRALSKSVVFLPRPLLSPPLSVLEEPDAARGVAYMLSLYKHAAAGEHLRYELPTGSLHVYRRR